MADLTPAQRADRARLAYLTGMCSRAEAIREIRKVLNVTDLGVGELLDHPEAPSARYAPTEGRCAVLSLAEALAALPDTADGIAAHLLAKGIRGVPADSSCCVLANYLTGEGFTAASVGNFSIGACDDDGGSEDVDTPKPVAEFVRRFDAGEWPELALDDAADDADPNESTTTSLER